MPYVLMPADGNPFAWPTYTDGYSSLGIDSIPFSNWHEGEAADNRVWVRIEQIANFSDSTTAQVIFHPYQPYLRLVSNSVIFQEVGTDWLPSFVVRNEGDACGPFEIDVMSSDTTGLFPDFTLEYPDSIQTGEIVTLNASVPVSIPNAAGLWGTSVALTLEFPYTPQHVTVNLIMKRAATVLNARFAYPVVASADTLGNRLLVASHDTLYSFDALGDILWIRVPWPGHSINEIVIGEVRHGGPGLEVGVIVDSQRIGLYSRDGQMFDLWPVESQSLSTPGAMIADGYVWYVDGTALRAYDVDLRVPPYLSGQPSRSDVTFPSDIHPDGWCLLGNPAMGDSVTGLAFAFTTGLNSRADGRFFVMDAGGTVIFPYDTIAADSSHGYGVPIATELIAADGWQEVWFHYFDQQNHGGIVTCAYSVLLDRIGLGFTEFGGREVIPIAQGATLGDPGNWVARQIFCYHDPVTDQSHMRIGCAATFLGNGRVPTYLLSTAFHSGTGGHVFAARDRGLRLFSPNGMPFGGGTGIVTVWNASDSAVGTPLVAERATGEAVLCNPVGDLLGWTFDHRVLPGHSGADWIGPYGDPSNTGRHCFHGIAAPDTCDGQDALVTTIRHVGPEALQLTVRVCGHPDWQVTGYRIYESASSIGPFDVTYYPTNGQRLLGCTIAPPGRLPLKKFYYATVEYEPLVDGQSLWGYHELPEP